MARPKPSVILEYVDPVTLKAEQVLDANAVYAVFFRGKPINVRTLHKLINTSPIKYKSVSFPNPGHALIMAKHLNELFNTKEFDVRELVAGNIYDPNI